MEKKYVSWFCKSYTLHNEYGMSCVWNSFPWRIPTKWRTRFIETCETIAGWDVPRQADMWKTKLQVASILLDEIKSNRLICWTKGPQGQWRREIALTAGKSIEDIRGEVLSTRKVEEFPYIPAHNPLGEFPGILKPKTKEEAKANCEVQEQKQVGLPF